MAEPFLSEIRIMSFNFAPKGWAMCNGQLMPINQNQALFSLLGTTYGGDGRVNFALPNLRNSVPIHKADGFTLGQKGGEPAHTVSMSEMPAHNHFVNASSTTGTANVPNNTLMLAVSTPQSIYTAATNLQAMDPGAVSNVGGSQAHENRQPYLNLNFCIALQGIFPSPN
jgi:microcystin-dependent protein